MTDSLPAQPVSSIVPANETERLAALHRYQVLDTPAEVAFDRITTLAARLFKMPTVLISLVDESRAWFKSSIGFGATELPRNHALCSFAVLTDEPLIVPDTRLDDRFTCNPLVQCEPGMRFYAGAPLIDRNGFNLGALCLLDTVPHDPLNAEEEATLVDLAAMVVDELELRVVAQQIARVDAALVEITQGVSRVTGQDFFDELVKHFAKVLGTDYVYIGLVEGTEPKMMRTIATCDRGNIVENLEYRLQDTPCWEAILHGRGSANEQRKLCCYPCNVQALFPDAPLLKPLAVESYVAIPFYGSDGNVLGLLGVMDGKPLEHVQVAESLLTIFASRIATELERQQSELILVEQTRLLEAVSTGQPLDECLSAICTSIAKLSPHTRACVLLTDDLRMKFPRSITPDFPPSLSHGFKNTPISELANGTCGTAVYWGQPIACSDIASDDLWSQSWRDLCIAHGIRACYSVPIIGLDNLPLGSLMLCFNEARLPTDWEDRLGEFGTKIASITIERKRSIEKLSESEERLSLALTAADMATWDADLSTGKTIWSDNHFQILGYDPATVDALTVEMCMRLVHPDDLAAVTQAWETAQRERSLYRIEHRFIRADSGRVVWVAGTGQFLDNYAGSAMRFVGVMFDITDRKQTETALVESQQRLKAIVDAIPHPVWVLGADGEFRSNNQQWLNYFGVSFPEAAATGWSQIDPDELAAIEQLWQLSMQTGMSYETEFRWHFGESQRWYLSRAEPIRDPSGQIVEWVGTNTDITNIKQVEAALQESQQFAQKIAETVPGMLYVYDLIEQRNIYSNRQSLELLGYTPEQFQAIGSAIAPTILHPDDLASAMAYLEGFDTVQSGQVRELEYRAQHKNGEWRWLLSRSTVFHRTPGGSAQQILGVSIDITARKQAEEELYLREAELTEAQRIGKIGSWCWNAQTAEITGSVELLRIYGLDPAPMPSFATFRRLFPQATLQQLDLEMQRALATGIGYEFDFQASRKDGTPIWITTRCEVVRDPAGTIVGLRGTNQDITERKQIEANLEQSNARFESAMLAVRGTVYEWDLQTQIMYRSKGLFELLGIRAEDASPTNEWWTERVHPDDLKRTQAEFLTAPAGIHRFESEYRVRHAAGHWIYVLDRSYFQYDSHGQLLKVFGFNTDITKRKRTEEQLHQSQLLVQRQLMEIEAIYQTAPIGLTILDRELRYVRLNQQLAEINGIDIDDHIGRTLREIVPSVADEDEPILNSIFTTGEPLLNIEISGETRAAPGVQRTWIQNCYPLKDATGQVAGINVVVQEITDRKQAEAELARANGILTATIDGTSDVIFVKDLQGKYIIVNSTGAEWLDTSVAAVLGRDDASLFPPEIASHIALTDRQVIQTGESIVYEEEIPYQGTPRSLLSVKYPWRDPQGQIVGVIGISRDITDRKRAETALQESRTQRNFLLAAAEFGDWDLNLADGTANRSLQHDLIFGYESLLPQWTYEMFMEHVLPEDRAEVDRKQQYAIANNQPWDFECQIRRADNQVRWIWASGYIYHNPQGVATRMLGLVADITDRKTTELALAERNQELTSFAYTVSHDLKAPLRAISNLSVWIEEDLEGKLPPGTEQQFDLLRTRVKRMESMIDSLLLYARAGRQEALLETFDLAELLAEIIDSLAPPEGFRIDIQPPLPTLTTKRVFLSQVFANLISNAIKHHNSVTGHLQISAIEHPDYHEFSIKDDGPGIAPEHHAKVFEIFTTLKVKDNSDSTGIGLAIVKKIIETEQGKIRLESSLGEGTTFYVTWPKSHG